MVTNDPITWTWKVRLFDRYFAFYFIRRNKFTFIHIGWLYITHYQHNLAT